MDNTINMSNALPKKPQAHRVTLKTLGFTENPHVENAVRALFPGDHVGEMVGLLFEVAAYYLGCNNDYPLQKYVDVYGDEAQQTFETLEKHHSIVNLANDGSAKSVLFKHVDTGVSWSFKTAFKLSPDAGNLLTPVDDTVTIEQMVVEEEKIRLFYDTEGKVQHSIVVGEGFLEHL